MTIINRITEGFNLEVSWFALVAAILVALCASLLGVTLVLKRFSFIGDGLSHVSFGAIPIAAVVGLTTQFNMLVVLPITIAAAVLLLAVGQNKKIHGDAALAMISVSALAFGYLLTKLFSNSANPAGDVCTALFGNIITLDWPDVWLCVGMAALVIPVFIIFYNKIFAVTFDETFAKATGTKANIYNLVIAVVIAVVIVIAMKLVGSLLISALIIFPAMTAMRIYKSFKSVIVCSAVVAAVCAGLGVFLSVVFETPVGATIVVTNLCAFGIFSVLRLVVRKRAAA